MTHVIGEPCIGTKDTACVDVCPVDCIHPTKDEPEFEGAEMLYIDPDACIDCGLCDKVCMARLPVSGLARVSSAECTGCLDCVATCPVPQALEVGASRRLRLTTPAFALTVLLLFLGGYSGARMAGLWRSDLTDVEYTQRIRDIDRPEYGHPGQ